MVDRAELHPFSRADASPGGELLATLADRVAAAPDRIAISSKTQQLSYQQLWLASERLAGGLAQAGLGAEHRVGLEMPRGAALVVAMVAALRAGVAYLPLDPALPPARRTAVARTCRLSQILSEDVLPTFQGTLRCRMHPGLAYIHTTSGSTGAPKGVLVERTGLDVLARAFLVCFPQAAGGRMTLVSPPSFDALSFEVWTALGSGATLCIVPEELRFQPQALRDWLVAEAITCSFQPTPVAEALLSLRWPSCRLHTLLTAGGQLRRCPPQGLPFALFNLYGPAEDTIWTTWARISPGGDVPIGRPIDGHRVVLLDRDELGLAGAGLARGYAGDPRTTAETFSPAAGGQRLYRSGDRARWSDGQLHFLGRLGRRITHRGHRIEPEEIEQFLIALPGVVQAVAVQCGESIRAFVTGEPDLAIIRRSVAQNLPRSMQPGSIVWLDALPLTRQGKLDLGLLQGNGFLQELLLRVDPSVVLTEVREQPLALCAAERLADLHAFATARLPLHLQPRFAVHGTEAIVATEIAGEEAKRTAQVRALRAAWQQVVGTPPRTDADDFFAAGGDSLAAAELIAALRSAGLAARLEDLYANPQFIAFGRTLRVAHHDVSQTDAIPREQAQLVVFQTTNPGSSAYNLSLGLQIGGTTPAQLAAALHALSDRFPILREALVLPHRVPGRAPTVQIRSPCSLELALAHARQQGLEPYDLEQGPLLRADLYPLPNAELLLALHMHHAIWDNRSIEVFCAALGQQLAGEGGPVDHGFSEYAALPRPPRVRDGALPLRPRPSGTAAPGGEVWTLPRLPAAGLRAGCRRARTTLFTALAAGLALALAEDSGQDVIHFGFPVSERRGRWLGSLGYFVSTRRLSVDLSGSLTPSEILARTHWAISDAPCEGGPLHCLLSLNRYTTEIPGLSVIEHELWNPIPKVDFSLSLREWGDSLSGVVIYRAGLYCPDTIGAFTSRWRAALTTIEEAPDEPLVRERGVIQSAGPDFDFESLDALD